MEASLLSSNLNKRYVFFVLSLLFSTSSFEWFQMKLILTVAIQCLSRSGGCEPLWRPCKASAYNFSHWNADLAMIWFFMPSWINFFTKISCACAIIIIESTSNVSAFKSGVCSCGIANAVTPFKCEKIPADCCSSFVASLKPSSLSVLCASATLFPNAPILNRTNFFSYAKDVNTLGVERKKIIVLIIEIDWGQDNNRNNSLKSFWSFHLNGICKFWARNLASKTVNWSK